MNLSEAGQILALATAYDRRTVGDADIAAWHAALDDLTFIDCKIAVRKHYRNTSRWLMPADVRELVRSLMVDRSQRMAIAPVASGAGMPEELRERVDGMFGMPVDSPHPKVSGEQRRAGLSVRCPYCGSTPGVACSSKAGPMSVSHPGRVCAGFGHPVVDGGKCDCGAVGEAVARAERERTTP